MLRPLTRLLLGGMTTLALVSTPAGCGGTEKPKKTAKSKKERQKDTRAMLSEAREQAKEGDVDGADASYSKAFDIGKEIEILQEHVEYLIEQGRVKRAQEVAKSYYDANSTDPKGYILYAEALLAGERGEEALEVADQLIALNAEDAGGHEKRGRALMLLDRGDEGIEELRKAVTLDDTKPAHLIALGLALHAVKKVDEAALKFRAALALAPDDPKIHVYLGMARRDQGELDEAKGFLDKAIELDAKNGRAYYELGLLYNRQGKQADAEQSLSKAVQLSPNESRFWYVYGEIYRVQDRTEEAVNAYKKAVELDPPFPKAITKLTSLLIEKKQYDTAEELLTPIVRRDGKNFVAFLALGDLFAERGKKKPAIDNYSKYLEYAPKSDPERPRVSETLKTLKRR